MRWRGLVFGLICAVWLLCLLPSAWLAAMATSAPGDIDQSLGGRGLTALLATLPLVLLLAPIAGLIARSKGQGRAAWWLVAAPLLWIAAALALAAFVLPAPGRTTMIAPVERVARA